MKNEKQVYKTIAGINGLISIFYDYTGLYVDPYDMIKATMKKNPLQYLFKKLIILNKVSFRISRICKEEHNDIKHEMCECINNIYLSESFFKNAYRYKNELSNRPDTAFNIDMEQL
jgi:hypothetical protein